MRRMRHQFVAFCVLVSCAPRIASAGEVLQTGNFFWISSEPLVMPPNRPEDKCYSVKDPSIVQHEGKWHLFCTIRSEKRTHQIEYSNFRDWKDADRAPRHI